MSDADVVACIVSHRQRDLLGPCLEALRADGIAAIVLENVPDGSAALATSLGARASVATGPSSFARNQNALITATSSRYVLIMNPDCVVRPGAVARLVALADDTPNAGVVGPRLLELDGTLQRSRRRFPTVAGTLVRRTPLRLLRGDLEAAQPHHYLADVPSGPVRCDWMLGACLLLRREMLDEIGGFDEGFPMYGEDIELQYRAMRAGWERWYVPDAVAVHEYQRVIDRKLISRRSLWHLRGMARFVRLHPESLTGRRTRIADDPGMPADPSRTIEQENAELRESLSSILESASWRLTRPLRRLRGSTRPEVVAPSAAGQAVKDTVPVVPAPPEPSVPLFVPPGHFYSPIVDPAEVLAEPRRAQVFPAVPATPGIDWHDEAQVALCRDVFARQTRLSFPEQASDDATEYFAANEQYPPLDAWMLEGMLRWLRPRRMIEVGSGFSSLVSARVNREELGGELSLTCIEPYPRAFLSNGIPGISRLLVSKVQDVPLEEFEALESGDVLFVDTSHVVKTGGDVTWLFHEIIPRLAPGVVVHVHDIFLPFDYPEPWVIEGRSWNENQLVHSFLLYNAEFEVVIGAGYMAAMHANALAEAFPGWPIAASRGGGALWLRRRDSAASANG